MESAVPNTIWPQILALGPIDLVVGIPSFNNAATITRVVSAAAGGSAKHFPGERTLIVNSDGGSTDGTGERVQEAPLPSSVQSISFAYQGIPGKGTALRAIFEVVARLSARACVVLDADLRSVSPDWIPLLAGPVVDQGFDYVAPLYLRHKYDGTITNNIAYPLTSALYGLRVRQPIGGDFGMSRVVVEHFLAQDVWQTDVARFGIDTFMTTVAINDGFKVCQSRLGAKIHDVKDPAASLGPMFVQVVGTLFALMDKYSARWPNIKRTKVPPTFGDQQKIEPEPIKVTVSKMVDEFKAGAQGNEALWLKVLDSENLNEIKALVGWPVESFAFPAPLWSRVVYDFASAYHQAGKSGLATDEIVSALTPLYYGRTAAMVLESGHMNSTQFEELIGDQERIFEKQKRYLLKKWNR